MDCMGGGDATYVPIMLSLKSILSDTFAMTGSTSLFIQSRASGHFDMMCTSMGTFVSASSWWSAQVHVLASQNRLTSKTTMAAWKRLLLWDLRRAMVSSALVASATSRVSGRSGAFSCIVGDGIGADAGFM